jgi:hypothetical protein
MIFTYNYRCRYTAQKKGGGAEKEHTKKGSELFVLNAVFEVMN